MKIWFQALRPKTLMASFGPVFIGAALAQADGLFHLGAVVASLMGALAIQVGTNLTNDYMDFFKGADNADRIGPTRVTQAGLIKPAQVRAAAAFFFVIALIIGTYLVGRGGWPVVAIGLVSILCGVLYTAGPYPLAYVGLGDLFVLIFFGPVAVAGTYYVQALRFSSTAFWAGIAPGLLSVAILSVNNLRDARGDARVGKKTLAVRFGDSFVRLEYAACIVGAALVPLVLVYQSGRHSLAFLGPLVLILAGTKPLSLILFQRTSGKNLNPLLGSTARLLFIESTVFSVGWTIS